MLDMFVSGILCPRDMVAVYMGGPYYGAEIVYVRGENFLYAVQELMRICRPGTHISAWSMRCYPYAWDCTVFGGYENQGT